MSARGFVASSLRVFLLVTAVMLSASIAGAEEVRLTHTGVLGQVGNAGMYKWNVDVTSPSLGVAANQTLYTFCISPTITLVNPDWYLLRDDIQNLPSPPGGMGIPAASKIAILVNEIFGNGSQNAWNVTGNYDEIQNAIWRFIDGGSHSGLVTTMINHATGLFTANGGLLSNYYSNLPISFTNPVYIHGLDANTPNHSGGQSQIYWNGTPNYSIAVPVPAGAVLSGIGIFCISCVSFIRRRKLAASV